MQIKKFSFENFKGINSAVLNLARSANANVFTLVGPNECGKTTVLEAIHNLKIDTENQAVLEGAEKKETAEDFVSIGNKGSFSGKIVLSVSALIEDEDKDTLRDKFHEKFGCNLVLSSIKDNIDFTRVYTFKDGDYQGVTENWDIGNDFEVENDSSEEGSSKTRPIESSEWEFLEKILISLLPRILYFPNLLSRFPDKIYLDNDQVDDNSQKEINTFYLRILQDVLTVAQNSSELQIKEHILDRIISGKDSDKEKVQNILNNMGTQITKDIQKAWNAIFSKNENISDQRIELSNSYDKVEKDGNFIEKHYIQFRVKENAKDYSMRQRSLGFRWFFCFFLFTIYRAQEEKSILYLFDEPASNLHPKAQMKLLESLTKISETGAKIIYSTHSHHLIKPEWLEAAFVIRNNATNYEMAADVRPEQTDIQVTPYRRFLNDNSKNSTYFQPIMDALDYKPSELEKVKNVVLVEGKSDFYYFKYFKDVIFKNNKQIDFMPGRGSGSLEPLICLYQGWGKDFIIMLDSDGSGDKETTNYNTKHYVAKDKIFTLHDVDNDFENIAAEKLFDPDDIAKILNMDVEEIKVNIGKIKKPLTFKIQELLAQNKDFTFSENTKNNFEKVLNHCYKQFPEEPESTMKAA